MTDMLTMAAGQLGDPVIFVILVKACDRLFDVCLLVAGTPLAVIECCR